jgi:hypothetical protein
VPTKKSKKPVKKKATKNKEREETLTTIYAVVEELYQTTAAASISRVPLGALKCVVGGLYCALHLINDFNAPPEKK